MPMSQHPTLDAELVAWWECEAQRLEALAGTARIGFFRRRYERKAAEARARAQVSRVREAARRGETASS
jgi:predicted aminopeptidase